MSHFNYETDTWKILNDYFNEDKNDQRLIDHHLDSYDEFMKKTMCSIIENNNPIRCIDEDSYKYNLYISDIVVKHPTKSDGSPIYPFEARSRNISYMCDVFVNIKEEVIQKNLKTEKIHENILFTRIPCMIRSKFCNLYNKTDDEREKYGECRYDLGGYFIINGGEKVVVSQERIAENKIYVWPAKNNDNKFILECEIKSSSDQRFNPIKTTKLLLNKSEQIVCKISGFSNPIPLSIIYKALGFVNDKMIIESILGDQIGNEKFCNFIAKSLIYVVPDEDDEDVVIYSSNDAVTYLSTQLNSKFGCSQQYEKNGIVYDILYRELFPQTGNILKKKALLLSHMMKKLIQCYYGIRPYDTRDSYLNKRLNVTGTLFCPIFRTTYINVINEIKNIISSKKDKISSENTFSNMYKLFSSSLIESKFRYVLSTGNWSTSKGRESNSDKGVAQVLNRIGWYSYLSHMRRIKSPLETSGSKIIEPRKLHMTHYGMCCPNETPEGQEIGIIKNLSLQCKISKYNSDFPIRQLLKRIKNKSELVVIESSNINTNEILDSCVIILNGDIFGYIKKNNVNYVHQTLLALRRHNQINNETSISLFIEWNELVIQTDGGRYMRPLYIVNDDGKLLVEEMINKKVDELDYENLYSWDCHLKKDITNGKKTKYNGNCIEYLDTSETENSLIALNNYTLEINNKNKSDKKIFYKYTHCEIHPSMMVGAIAQMIPFSNHNQSPRNIYQSSMGKQAIGTYATNYKSRFDTMAHVLVHGQKPLVQTRTMKWTKLNHLPHGANAMLAVATYEGFNQEDAQIMNEDSVNRGFFNTLFYRSYNDVEVKHKNTSSNNEKFMNPCGKSNIIEHKIGKWSAIDDNGLPKLGEFVTENSAIIGKVIEMKDQETGTINLKDISTLVRNYEHGTIDDRIPNNVGPFKDISNIDSDGNKFVSVRVVQYRKPEIGDKFASRHSQKGCLGKIEKSINLPFTESGLIPDIIMNPHGFPSRMTEAKVLEVLYGKAGLCTGKFQDGTLFLERDFKSIEDILSKHNFDKYGDEYMYCGKTGKKYKAKIFYGPVYYQRLKHMVIDKMHSRDTGPTQMLTRQPVEGRSRAGGLRIGEMERDCLISHGVQKLLKERFMDCSDSFVQYVDKKTGQFIIGNSAEKIYAKPNQESVMEGNMAELQIPYSADLMIKELKAMGINFQIFTK